MTKVVIYHDLPIAAELRTERPELNVVAVQSEHEARRELKNAAILITTPSYWSASFLAHLDAGNWIQSTSAGYEAYPVEEFRNRGILFTTSANLHDTAVSEHVFALMFALSRNLRVLFAQQNQKVWDREVGTDLWNWKGRQLTILGLGNIGEAVARRGCAFGMDVYGLKRNPADYSGVLSHHRVRPATELLDLLSDTDVLVLTLPLTAETHHIIDREALAALPATASVINVGRGALIDEVALIEALKTNALAGAGLDVVESEPLSSESPLWDLDNVVLSPHIGARRTEFVSQFLHLFGENYDRREAERPLANRIA